MSESTITVTFNPSPRPEEIEDFYNKTLHAVLQGVLSNNGATSPCFAAERHAREVTERRFGVKLILPTDRKTADA